MTLRVEAGESCRLSKLSNQKAWHGLQKSMVTDAAFKRASSTIVGISALQFGHSMSLPPPNPYPARKPVEADDAPALDDYIGQIGSGHEFLFAIFYQEHSADRRLKRIMQNSPFCLISHPTERPAASHDRMDNETIFSLLGAGDAS